MGELSSNAQSLAERIAERAAERAVAELAAGVVGRLDQLEFEVVDLADQVIAGRSRRRVPAPVRDPLRPQIIAALTRDPQPTVEIEQAVGRPPRDSSTRRVLVDLTRAGIAERDEEGWRLAVVDGRCPACRRRL